MFRSLTTSLIAGAALALPVTLQAHDHKDKSHASEMKAQPNIVAIAASNDNFSTLVAAVKAAKLVDTLASPGPFTVFAPTNAAFDALPAGTVDQLVTQDTDTLGSILTYHVVAGEVMSGALIEAIQGAGYGGSAIETVKGATLTATLEGGNVVLTDATGAKSTVVATDVDASNGVVHVIDTVLMPG
ncbi:MAG: fasciclin domain-containing protein [Sphingomonadaceae bacterium]|nr:MAG: fasciclin domain-containing protein [Sphingomonadaceae bacterium]